MADTVDILVSGGGIAGMAAAVAFGGAGFKVLCVDPVPPVTDRTAKGADLRTTAYLQPSQDFLAQIGIWPRVANHAAALQTMAIVDATVTPPSHKAFQADDVSTLPFGWNVGNWQMRQAMLDQIAALPSVEFRPGISTTRVFTRTTMAQATLSDGSRVNAKLVIAADGRNSPIRMGLGIPVQKTDFDQLALAFAVNHVDPHENISTEVHRSGGPFTLVPLPDHLGKPCSAVVWMDQTQASQARLELPNEDFSKAATERSAGILGDLTLISRRTPWPIIAQLADQFYGERVALLAEAAHVLPPIGAQGLNISLGDVACLLDLCQANPDQIGSPGMLQAYDKDRRAAARLRVSGVGLLNRASITSSPILQQARNLGLEAIHGIKPLRKSMMRLGLGVR